MQRLANINDQNDTELANAQNPNRALYGIGATPQSPQLDSSDGTGLAAGGAQGLRLPTAAAPVSPVGQDDSQSPSGISPSSLSAPIASPDLSAGVSQPIGSGLQGKTAPVVKPTMQPPLSRADMAEAYSRIAARNGDMTQATQLLNDARDYRFEDEFGKHMSEYTGSDDQIGDTSKYVNTNYPGVTMSKPDPKTGMVSLAIVNPDGTATFKQLSKPQQAQVYAAGQLLQTNPTKALTVLNGIDTVLASHVAAATGISEKVATTNNDASFKGQDLGIKQQQANTMEGYRRDMAKAANTRADAAKTKAESAYEKLPDGQKLAITQAGNGVSLAQKNLDSLQNKIAESGVAPTPTQIDAVNAARNQLVAATANHQRALFRTGLVDETDIADQILVNADDPATLEKSLAQARQLYGASAGDAIAKAVKANPAYAKNFAAPAQPSPAAAVNPITAGITSKAPVAPAQGMRGGSFTPRRGGGYGISANSQRGVPTTYNYRGNVYSTREAAQAAQAADQK